MSDIPTDFRDRLDLREQLLRIDDAIARIDRQRQETQKFVAEHDKLVAEGRKLGAENDKLEAEARKLDRDRWLAPALAAVTILSAIFTGIAFLATRFPGIFPSIGAAP